jgi:hypothetical protein
VSIVEAPANVVLGLHGLSASFRIVPIMRHPRLDAERTTAQLPVGEDAAILRVTADTGAHVLRRFQRFADAARLSLGHTMSWCV